MVAGLLTRVIATLLAGSMTVALLTADRQGFITSWGSASESSPTDVASWVFLLFLLWLIVHGSGVVSLDCLPVDCSGAGSAPKRLGETGGRAAAKRESSCN